MTSSFEAWLREKGCSEGTISTKIARIRRVEEYHGNLDNHFRRDHLASVLDLLRYSSRDERQGRSNPTLIPINGILRTNLASYGDAVRRYQEFLSSEQLGETSAAETYMNRSRHTYSESRTADPKTLADFALDGLSSLAAIIGSSRYTTMAQAVASLTLFTHPDTVRQTGGQAIFFAVRDPRRVGEIAEVNGRRVVLDDNKSPTDAFLWANRIRQRGRDTQFNHIYASRGDVDTFTALPNICMTPAFVAKLTDTNRDIKNLLKFRSFDLYGWHPAAQLAPPRPKDYDSLEWAPPLAPVPDVRRAIADAMFRKQKDRTVRAAKELGWLFDRQQPRS